MVAAVQVAVGDRQQVADLPVGVVDDRVEDRHLAQPAWSLRRASATRSTSGSRSIHSWHMPGPNGPSRMTVGGTKFQPARPGHRVGGDLPARQGPGREVPQRPLTRDRLVHAVRLGARALDRAEQGRVGRVDEAALYRQRAALEQLERLAFAVRDVQAGGRGIIRHCRPGGRSAAGRRARRRRAAARTAGTAAVRPRPAAARAARTRAPRSGVIRTRSTPGPSTGTSSDSGSTGASLSSCASMTTRSPSLSQASAIAPTRKSSVSGRSSGRVVAQRRRRRGRDVGGLRRCGAAPRRAARRCARPAG